MYLDPVDHATRDEIAAAAGAHADLGSNYDAAVAEGLIERIGAEIDRRVDARLAMHPARPVAPAYGPPRSPAAAVIVALGTVGLGVGATAITLFSNVSVGAVTPENVGAVHISVGAGQLLVLAIIWAAIAVVNVAFSRRR
jgi:hypothetical protein